ncbi:MAG TPA: rhodanese-like domain-containing protein [Thermodesulfobacteriota bacterium]|nr:rhodanese-like domain-containing protein [Thermodesulfobacteriota bacterium]
MKKSFRSTASLLLAYGAITLATVFSVASAQEVQSIKPEDLKKLMESKSDFVVVDTQPKSAYDTGHIAGAVNFPWASQIKTPANLPRNKLLVLYCACGHEEDSIDVAKQLMKKFGYKQVKVLEGGWLRWEELGYPTVK